MKKQNFNKIEMKEFNFYEEDSADDLENPPGTI